MCLTSHRFRRFGLVCLDKPMSSSFKTRICAAVHAWRLRRHAAVVQQLSQALLQVKDPIPCFVVCYNNAAHVQQMVQQLNAKGLTPIIFDNASTCAVTREWLHRIHDKQAFVVHVGKNLRHKVGFLPGIYDRMPEVFAYTDPDLLFDGHLPSDFLLQLKSLTLEYRVFKAGCALTLDSAKLDPHLTIQKSKCGSMPFSAKYTVFDWESQFWRFPLQRSDALKVFAAPVDTTFAVYNKSQFKGSFMDGVRVAGAFAVIHLSWYPELNNMSAEEKARYASGNKSSTWV